MKRSDRSAKSPTLTFAGAAALLLLVAAFCAFPCRAYVPAVGLTALALISLSLSAPHPEEIRVRHRPRSFSSRSDR